MSMSAIVGLPRGRTMSRIFPVVNRLDDNPAKLMVASRLWALVN